MGVLPYVVGAWLFVAGLWGVATSRNRIHLTVCIAVLQAATYLFLISTGYRSGGQPPITLHATNAPFVDPLVQALALTDIVVGATVTALLLAMAVQLKNQSGGIDPDTDRPMRNDG